MADGWTIEAQTSEKLANHGNNVAKLGEAADNLFNDMITAYFNNRDGLDPNSIDEYDEAIEALKAWQSAGQDRMKACCEKFGVHADWVEKFIKAGSNIHF